MEPVWVLTLLSLSMLAGCYLAGIIPLVMPMSEDRLEVVTVLGAGLLVGTALTVIIPEGVNTLLSAHMESHERDPHDHSSSEHMEPHTVVGVSLLLGFLLMLLIDQCAGGHPKPDTENGGAKGRRASMTATLGLVVHAAADGIALGAAAASSHTDVEMIVFFAIMLHKAPAAFGLVTFLLHEGLERNKIRRHLLVFALAAPIGAVGTFLSIVQINSALAEVGRLRSSSSSPPIAPSIASCITTLVLELNSTNELNSIAYSPGLLLLEVFLRQGLLLLLVLEFLEPPRRMTLDERVALVGAHLEGHWLPTGCKGRGRGTSFVTCKSPTLRSDIVSKDKDYGYYYC
ncbi:zinc/iron regulated transporter-related protein 102B isoform X2 [Oratosquilla oratoria]|uniref:zinc/iron regulated transporter-related protein 102B isoform X2 n=1 Tax=Oratosquilla oratoria TaxID=337810 RepID=UPI003F759737